MNINLIYNVPKKPRKTHTFGLIYSQQFGNENLGIVSRMPGLHPPLNLKGRPWDLLETLNPIVIICIFYPMPSFDE